MSGELSFESLAVLFQYIAIQVLLFLGHLEIYHVVVSRRKLRGPVAMRGETPSIPWAGRGISSYSFDLASPLDTSILVLSQLSMPIVSTINDRDHEVFTE
jgi:hypothetical protein